jgi:Flp pilus assembly protein TadD
MASGQTGPAETALREALRMDPYDSTAYDLIGRALTGKGEMAEAIYNFEKAIRLRPNFGPHLYDYALALARVNQFDEAQQSAQAAVEAGPSQAEVHELLGMLFSRKRQLAEAIREYRKAVELRPDFSRAHYDLGAALAAQGDNVGAAQHLREAAAGRDPQAAREATRLLQQIGVP